MTIRQKSKRYTALIMAMALVWSLPIYVSAADLAQSDEANISELTANVDTDVCQVIMPTNTEGIFDFILDPQGLINETDGAMYKGKKFEKDCTVFFRRLDGKVKEDYSRKSDSVTITNKSTMPVEVSLEVKVDPVSLAGIEMTEDSGFKKDKSASLYLAVADGEKEVPVGKDGVTIHKTIEAAPDGAYGYEYDGDKKEYTYGLKNDADNASFDRYSFQITGAANKKGNWAELSKAVPKIVVTWKITPGKNTELRNDAILRENKAADEISEEQEESDKQAADEKPEDKKDEEEQIKPDEDEAENKQELPDDSSAVEGDVPADIKDENESKNEDLNDIAE